MTFSMATWKFYNTSRTTFDLVPFPAQARQADTWHGHKRSYRDLSFASLVNNVDYLQTFDQ